ncbi:MAG: 2-polyprenylphenol 6-hydroxylase [Alphaproteobacteria bacterium CG_4_10_14_0_2_um_filter_63_37]|nr:MAG: 2-polyprenylphenol 6-hydroxylase [Proteobacteria bacterium CG1_02_64_396]PJA23624.1 MAG: 2-polyprenylphenol 6-hydroxylase [Alphaproteobacteria bacterium CG_4_10_14_0_2_um_filter_63_37]
MFHTLRIMLRLLQITRVLVAHGLDELADRIHLFRLYVWIVRPLRRSKPQATSPARFVQALLDLGPTFIKLGQALSTRADMLPEDWVGELSRLQDEVPPEPFKSIRPILEEDLHAPLEEVFPTFEQTAAASASIAQVHRAVTRDGREVAVKVRRPKVVAQFKADIEVMEVIARLIDRYWIEARRFRPMDVVAEFERTSMSEIDLMREAAHASRLAERFRDDPDFRVPQVYWDLCSSRVLVLEWMGGIIPIDETERIKAAGIDVHRLSQIATEVFFKQVFRDGFFHADMHAGNVFVDAAGRVVALDFGIVGTVDEATRRNLAGMLTALVRKDYHKAAVLHLEAGFIDETVNIVEFEQALRAIAEPIFDKPLREISIGDLLQRMLRTTHAFHMQLQPQLILLQKTMVAVEGLGRRLDPDLNVWEVARPWAERWMAEQMAPKKLAEKGFEKGEAALKALVDLPETLHSLGRAALHGKIVATNRIPELLPIRRSIDRAGQGVVTVIASTALLVGGAQQEATFLGQHWMVWMGLGGLVVALWIVFRPGALFLERED